MQNFQDTTDYNQMGFNLPHDVVTLPSMGRYYKSKKKSVKIGYLTAKDENLIASFIDSPNKENIIFSLIRSKLYEPDLKPEELMYCDVEAILLFLRNTSFGTEYTINATDPKTGQKFTETIHLDELNIKKPTVEPDETGCYVTILPRSNKKVKVRPLTFHEDLEINKEVEKYPSGMVAPRVTWRLMKQIVEIDGNSSPEFISNFIENMMIADSKHIRNFLTENEPGLDLTKQILAPSGERVSITISFGVEFFRPFF
jgi:hypothetical protein